MIPERARPAVRPLRGGTVADYWMTAPNARSEVNENIPNGLAAQRLGDVEAAVQRNDACGKAGPFNSGRSGRIRPG